MVFDNHFCSPPWKSLFLAEKTQARPFLPASRKTLSIIFYYIFTVIARRWTKLLLYKTARTKQRIWEDCMLHFLTLLSWHRSLPEKDRAPSLQHCWCRIFPPRCFWSVLAKMESPVVPHGVRLPALLNIQCLDFLQKAAAVVSIAQHWGAHAGEHAVLPHQEEVGGV